jgi:hypothetical protein
VVVIDELADLMMVVGKKVEGADRAARRQGARRGITSCSRPSVRRWT